MSSKRFNSVHRTVPATRYQSQYVQQLTDPYRNSSSVSERARSGIDNSKHTSQVVLPESQYIPTYRRYPLKRHPNQMYKTEICRDFMRNRCLFADDCRHIHPGENDSKTRTKPVPKFEYHTNRMEKTEICLNFLDKRCTWGDRCHRIHPLPNIETNVAPPILHVDLHATPVITNFPPVIDGLNVESDWYLQSLHDLFQKPDVLIVKIPKAVGIKDRKHRHLENFQIQNVAAFSISIPADPPGTCVVNVPNPRRRFQTRASNKPTVWDPGIPPGLPPRPRRESGETHVSDTSGSDLFSSIQTMSSRSSVGHASEMDGHNKNDREGRPEPTAPSQPQSVEPPVDLIININHSKVKFGPGFQVLDVTTGFESRWIFIAGIPSTLLPDDVARVLKPFGKVVDVKFAEWISASTMTVKAHFATHSEAVQAATALNGAQLFDHKVDVRLAVGDARNLNGSLKDTSILVEWEAPGRVAYAGYATLEDAEAAITAARTPVCGSFISAHIYHGLPAVGAYNVRFQRLPPDAQEKDVECFGQPETVMLERPTYISLKGAVKGIQGMLENLGNMTNFEMVPPPYQDGMVHAWATFSSPQAAKAAADRLHGLRPNFVGKGFLWAYHMKTMSYKVPQDAFAKIESEIYHLRDSCWSRFGEGTFLRVDRNIYSSNLREKPVRIVLSGENLRNLGCLKSEFEAILRGEVLRQDGKATWDRFFSQPAGKEFLEGLERQHHPVSIRTDLNRQLIILVGASRVREIVRETLLKKITQLNRHKVRGIPIAGKTIGLFMSADLMRLQKYLGRENVVLDLTRRLVSVRGDDDVFEAAQRAVQRAEINEPSKRNREMAECPVCFNDASRPVILGCGHSWCKACLSAYIVAAIDNKLFPLTCLGNEASCPQLLSIATARGILSASDFDSVVHASFLTYVHSRPSEFYYCPTPNCRQIYRTAPENTILQCPECLIRICPKCRVEYHDGLECADHIGSTEQQFKEWSKKHDVKNCPGCKAPIERTEGCNHMTCTRCQTHICWVCMKTFPKGQGIYGHMRRMHGGIGL